MIRSALALLAGFGIATFALVAALRISPPLTDNPSVALRDAHAWFAVGYAVVAAFAGSYACAWIAGRAELQHAGILGTLLVLAAILVIQTGAWQQPRWYQFAMAGCAPLAAVIAAHTRLLLKRPVIRSRGEEVFRQS